MNTNILRREFFLPEEDIEYLNATGLDWETIKDGNDNWLIIHNFTIPKGYNVNNATVAVLITASYPMAALDMVYFYPTLLRIDGRLIPATQCMVSIQGREYQRWSRHWTAENPWRCGFDNISSHNSLVQEWLLREVGIN